MPSPSVLPVSLVIVSDFEPGPKSWADEDGCLRRCLSDPAGIPAQIVVAASGSARGTAPPDWSFSPVPVKVIFVDSEYSGTIKNGATRHVTEDLVAVVEADCLALPGWLAALYEGAQADPAADVVTGLTFYEPTTSMRRVAGLYDRGYLTETTPEGRARHISNNGALYKKSVLEQFPYSEEASPFVSAHIRHLAMHRMGLHFTLAPSAAQYHAYGGWPFIFDVRKNKGLQHLLMREHELRIDPTVARRLWWVLRLFGAGLVTDYHTLRRAFRTFCKPGDLPLALIFPLVARCLEIPGALQASFGHRSVPGTAYR